MFIKIFGKNWVFPPLWVMKLNGGKIYLSLKDEGNDYSCLFLQSVK